MRRRPPFNIVMLLLGFALVLGSMIGVSWLSVSQRQALAQVSHSLEVLNHARIVLSRLQDAETGQRGYLLTGRPEFLAPYRSAQASIGNDLLALRNAVADNPDQMVRVGQLERIVTRREQLLSAGVELRRRNDPRASETARLMLGKTLMDQARRVVADLEGDERRLLKQRQDRASSINIQLTVFLFNAALAILLLGWYAVRDARRRFAAARRSADLLAKANAELRTEAESRKQAEAQIRQMQKVEAIGQLTGGIAHDFNNMLAIVIGSLDMAKRRLTTDHRRAEDSIDNAMAGAERAAQLTSQLLAFSRQQPLNPTVLDLNKLVAGMSELLRRTLGDNLLVETVLAGGLWRTAADAPQLENALLNLCINARDAMPDGGRLTIETLNAHLDDHYAAQHVEVTPGQYVVISVTDSGVGMSPETAERAFDPFYTTKGAAKGTGLGLSQVFGFVKQSGGHVKIYSELGVGTTVKLYLRRHSGNEDIAEIPARKIPDLAEPPRARQDEIILLVEDEERVRDLSADALRDLGYRVVSACDASHALALLPLQDRVDLLFTDIVMPGMNGRLLADKVKELRPGTPILYTTGYTRNAIVHNGVLDTGVHFLAKPFTIDQLATKVREAIDKG